MWLGLVAIDGQVPGGVEDAGLLQAAANLAPGAARREGTAFTDNRPTEGMDVTEVRTFFAALYRAWCEGVSNLD